MSIVIPIVAVTVIGLLCGVMLTVANKFMSVPEDETFVKVRECLPGANCGACGYTGCDGYAHALAGNSSVKTNLCVPGADAVAAQIAAVLGVEAEDVVERAAYVGCAGCETKKDEYQGIPTCAAANLLFGGNLSCAFGCLGFGDCANACPQNAICIEDGVAHVQPALCVGCGLCTKVCPNHLIQLVPDIVKTVNRCSNTDKGAQTRKACGHGCIGCKKCEKACPAGAITVVNNCARIDYDKCTGCGECVAVCTTGCLTAVNFCRATMEAG